MVVNEVVDLNLYMCDISFLGDVALFLILGPQELEYNYTLLRHGCYCQCLETIKEACLTKKTKKKKEDFCLEELQLLLVNTC